MAAIPQQERTTVRVMDDAVARAAERRNGRRLGASSIGKACQRALWYQFRWAEDSRPEARPDGRVLRLFRRGHLEEAQFIEDMEAAGIQVSAFAPDGEQWEFTAIGGHFVAKMDAAALGIVEAPKTWHVVSFKTANDRNFKAMVSKGIEAAEPKYIAQAQAEMKLAELDRALILVVNKNDDTRYGERLHFDRNAADELLAKAQRIITAPRPLERLSEKPEYYACKFCNAHSSCHFRLLPPPSCRTCVHATAELDGDQRWSCARHGVDLTVEAQTEGCDDHVYIPDLTPWEQVDADGDLNRVTYNTPKGPVRNGTPDSECFASAELHAAQARGFDVLFDPIFLGIRADTDARIVPEPETGAPF